MDTLNINFPAVAPAVVQATFASFREDTKHSFIRAYDPKVAGLEGYRHAIIRYRDTSKGTAIKSPKMVTIPVVAFTDDYKLPVAALTVLRGVIEDQQDDIIRTMIDKNESLISWNDVTLDKCLETLTATRVSQRLTSDQIAGWVRVALKDAMEQRAAQHCESKLITEPDAIVAQVIKTANSYVEHFSKLAAPVPNLGQQAAMHLQNLLTIANVDDDIAKSLKKKLHAILNPQVAENGDL